MYPLRPFVSILLHFSAFHAIDEGTFLYFLKFKYHKSIELKLEFTNFKTKKIEIS